MNRYRIPCLGMCGRDVPVEFARGSEHGYCRKCRRNRAHKAAKTSGVAFTAPKKREFEHHKGGHHDESILLQAGGVGADRLLGSAGDLAAEPGWA